MAGSSPDRPRSGNPSRTGSGQRRNSKRRRSKSSRGSNKPLIYGITAGSVLLVVLIVGLIVFTRNRDDDRSTDSNNEIPANSDARLSNRQNDPNLSSNRPRPTVERAIKAKLPRLIEMKMKFPYVSKKGDNEYECVIPYEIVIGTPKPDSLYVFEFILHRRANHKEIPGRELKQKGTIRWTIVDAGARSGDAKESTTISVFRRDAADGPYFEIALPTHRSVTVPSTQPSHPRPAVQVVLSDVHVRRLTSHVFATEFTYRFLDGSHTRNEHVQVTTLLQNGRNGRGLVLGKPTASGRFRSVFAVKKAIPAGKIDFAVHVETLKSNVIRNRRLSKTVRGDVEDAKDVALEQSAFEFASSVRSIFDTDRKTLPPKLLDGIKVKVHGRVKNVFSDALSLHTFYGGPIVCYFVKPDIPAFKTGEDVVITGSVQIPSDFRGVNLRQARIVGRGDECDLRRAPRKRVTSVDYYLACRRNRFGFSDELETKEETLLEVTGQLTKVDKSGASFKGAGFNEVSFKWSQASEHPALKVGQMITIEALLSPRYTSGAGGLEGVRFLRIESNVDPEIFQDPKVFTSAELLAQFPAGKPVDVDRRICVRGVVQIPYAKFGPRLRQGQFVLTGSGGRTIVCKRPEYPSITTEKGGTYIIDGVVESSSDQSLELTKVFVLCRYFEATDLAKAFSNDPSLAQKKDEMKHLRVRGAVVRVRKLGSSAIVDLSGYGSKPVAIQVVDKDDVDRALKLKKRQTVVLQGEFLGVTNGIVSISNGRIVPDAKRDKS